MQEREKALAEVDPWETMEDYTTTMEQMGEEMAAEAKTKTVVAGHSIREL